MFEVPVSIDSFFNISLNITKANQPFSRRNDLVLGSTVDAIKEVIGKAESNF
jgi:hypothetical protein